MSKYSILIVDDQDADRYLLKRSLKKANVQGEVFESSNGKEALRFLDENRDKKEVLGSVFPPLLILLDINMPLLDGFEFLEAFSKMRDSQEEYKVCVIMMFSSSENPEDKKRAFSYSFVKDFLLKGETPPEQLKEKINAIVQQQLG